MLSQRSSPSVLLPLSLVALCACGAAVHGEDASRPDALATDSSASDSPAPAPDASAPDASSPDASASDAYVWPDAPPPADAAFPAPQLILNRIQFVTEHWDTASDVANFAEQLYEAPEGFHMPGSVETEGPCVLEIDDFSGTGLGGTPHLLVDHSEPLLRMGGSWHLELFSFPAVESEGVPVRVRYSDGALAGLDLSTTFPPRLQLLGLAPGATNIPISRSASATIRWQPFAGSLFLDAYGERSRVDLTLPNAFSHLYCIVDGASGQFTIPLRLAAIEANYPAGMRVNLGSLRYQVGTANGLTVIFMALWVPFTGTYSIVD